MSDGDAKKKWNTIYSSRDTATLQPSQVLSDYEFLLPTKGTALDLACGLGSNAIYLAEHGLCVHAWDISDKAVNNLDTLAKKNKLNIKSAVRDVTKNPPEKNSFDVICVSFFLDRSITGNIITALNENGLLFYQTFIHEKVSDNGPKNPNYRFKENELLNLYSPLHILVYQEHGCVGDTKLGIRDTALLVAQKRNSN